MTLRVQVTASDVAGWIRFAANAINSLISGRDADVARLTGLEAASTTLDGRLDTLEGQGLDARVTALETVRPAHPFRELAAAPGTPSEGQVYYDTVLHKARVWDGTTWQALW